MAKTATERSRAWRVRNPRPDDVYRAMAAELVTTIKRLESEPGWRPTGEELRYGTAYNLEGMSSMSPRRVAIEPEIAREVVDRYVARDSLI